MSIRSELNNTKHYLRESRKAILGRGGEISEKAGIKDIPEAVWSIPADTSLAFREDSEVAYEKVVPSGAEEYAFVKSLGGMSYKALGNNNLCSGDGVYTYENATQTQNIDLGFYEAGTYYFNFDFSELQGLGECRLDGYGYLNPSILPITFEIQEPMHLCLSIDTEYEMTGGEAPPMSGTVKNLMLCKADDEDKTYKHYSPILVSAKPTSLESRGAQLFNVNDEIDSRGNGKIYISDGKIKDDNVSSSGSNFIWFSQTYPAGTYTMMGKVNNQSADGYYAKYQVRVLLSARTKGSTSAINTYYNGYLLALTDGKSTTFTIEEPFKIGFVTIADTTGLAVEYYDIMLNRGTEAIPFTDYVGLIDTKALPEAVQSLDGWGLGIDAEYNNHIVWRNGRVIYVQEVKSYTFIGEEPWTNGGAISTGLYRYYTRLPIDAKKGEGTIGCINGLCSHYPTWNGAYNANTEESVRFGQGNAYFYLYLANELTTDEVKSLTQGMEIVYALAEPIETDITHLFTDTSQYLKVEGGGVVKANNERKEAVPSTLKYTIKVGS